MCGRYANFLAEQDLIDAFAIATTADDARLIPPRYNIAPTQLVQIVRPGREDPSARELETARWGLVPAWAKDLSIGSKIFNARIETIAEKPSFRTAFVKRRCIVPASGYYEWQTGPEGRAPYFIHPADDGVLAFAGLFELWKDKAVADAPWVVSCTVVTNDARGDMRSIHERQPVMLTRENWDTWLDPTATPDDLFAAAADPTPELASYRVGKAVGTVKNDDPSLVEPAE